MTHRVSRDAKLALCWAKLAVSSRFAHGPRRADMSQSATPDLPELIERVNSAQSKVDLAKKVANPKKRAQLVQSGEFSENDIRTFEKKLQSTSVQQLEADLSKKRVRTFFISFFPILFSLRVLFEISSI
jgi:hypothetical protein